MDIFYSFEMFLATDIYDYSHLLTYKDNKIQDIIADTEILHLSSEYVDESKIKVFS